MFFFLSKVLLFLLSPLFWIIFLLVVIAFVKKPNKKRNLIILEIFILLLFSNNFIFTQMARKWENPPTRLEDLDKYEYAILLGGFSNYDSAYQKVIFNEAGDRFCQTLQLYEQKKVRKIFISGGSGSLVHQDRTEADKIKGFFTSLGIPEKDVIMEMTSRNTHENAVNTAEYLKKHAPNSRNLLVTSAWHMPRALGCYKKVGLNVTPYSTDFMARPKQYDFDDYILPKAKVLSKWDTLIREWVGYVSYKVTGYL